MSRSLEDLKIKDFNQSSYDNAMNHLSVLMGSRNVEKSVRFMAILEGVSDMEQLINLMRRLYSQIKNQKDGK